MKLRSISAAVGAAVILLSVAACSSAGTTTCSQYAAMTSQDRQSLHRNLLSQHELQPGSVSNIAGLTEALENLCGLPSSSILSASTPTAASRNGTVSLDEAA